MAASAAMRIVTLPMLGRCSAIILGLLLAGCPLHLPEKTAPEYVQSNWLLLPGWQQADLSQSLAALRSGCTKLARRDAWSAICAEASLLDESDNAGLHRFFETRFIPWQLRNPDGSAEGLITGYYEPLLHGSRTADARYRFPVYGVPDDLLIIDLDKLYPQLKGMRLRGRLDGNRVVPYYDRQAIDSDSAPEGKEILWVDDEISLFFLQVQGSGRVQLADGNIVKLGYANQNGHPYNSIGKKLVAMGEMTVAEASMQSIRQWGIDHPERLKELLYTNPSYVFFREMPDNAQSAVGAMNVPLTPGYSMAVDRRVIPLGQPVFLATTWPLSERPLNRLMMAQDVGGAIKGAIRGDFFWGFGEDATRNAGSMKQAGRMWVLFPAGQQPTAIELPKH